MREVIESARLEASALSRPNFAVDNTDLEPLETAGLVYQHYGLDRVGVNTQVYTIDKRESVMGSYAAVIRIWVSDYCTGKSNGRL